MPENPAQPAEHQVVELTEDRGLDQVVMMAPVVEPEPVAPAPPSASSSGDAEAPGGTAPIDFDG
jgi:hypothetical protein